MREALLKNLGYTFKDESLLDLALTHASNRGEDNQRYEFLGDRVLNFCVAEWLCESYPDAREGELSKRLAALVCRETLAKIANDLALGPALHFGAAETADNGAIKKSVLSDAVEALLAAVYLDSDMPTVRELVIKLVQPYAETVPLQDAKSALQEWLQGQGAPLPEYSVLHEEGPSHAKRFTVQVSTQGHGDATGRGKSKRAAEQDAASALIKTLSDN